MARVEAGESKSDILSATGHTLGLHDINLEIQRGEIFVIMGLSGSGKSTLIRHFNRLIDPTRGKVIVDGEDIMTYDAEALRDFRRRKMSMVFQRFGLLPHYTVLQNVAFGLKAQGVDKQTREQKAQVWLDDVGLKGYEDQYPGQLSGGQQQRVGLARALCTDAEIMLMDEAFSALDPLIRSEMQDQLIGLQDRLRKTIVFITHDLDEALRIGDRIAILRDGKLVQVGKPADILLHPADDYVENFVRDVNRARALTVETVMQPATHRISAETVGEALRAMRMTRQEYAYHISDGNYRGAVALSSLEQVADDRLNDPLGADYYYDTDVKIEPENVIEEVIPNTLDTLHPMPVVDQQGELQGELSRQSIADVLSPVSAEHDSAADSQKYAPQGKLSGQGSSQADFEPEV